MLSFIQLCNSNADGFVSLGSFIGIFYEGVIVIGMVLVLIDLFRIYRVSKLSLTRDLLYTFIFITIGIIFSWVAKLWLWHHKVTDFSYNYFLQLIYTFKFSIACAVIGMYFLKMFFRTLYSEDGARPPISKKLITLKAVGLSIIFISQIPVAMFRTPLIGFLSDTIAFLILLMDMMFLIPFATKSFRKGKENQAFGRKFTYIGLMASLTFNMTIMFLLDRITMLLGIRGTFNELGYSVFYFVAWTSVLLALITAVYGFIKR